MVSDPILYDNKFINSCILFPLDSDDEDLPSHNYRTAMAYRRRSVFAEAYNPGGEEEVEKVGLVKGVYGISFIFKIVHPKTDEQRRRLVEAVKKIFLFKSLDQVSVGSACSLSFSLAPVSCDKVVSCVNS